MSNNKSMEQRVYEELKEAILQRKLAPGTQLIEQTLSEALQASRTPIRNGMKRLAKEGFINLIPNRGAFVVQQKKEELIQAYEMRVELECIAYHHCIKNIGQIDIHPLNLIIEDEKKAADQNEIGNYLAANKRFHMFFATNSGNMFLESFIEKILDTIDIYLQMYDTYYQVNLSDTKSIEEHLEIIDAIKHKAFKRGEALLRNHIINSLGFLKIEKVLYGSVNSLF